MQCISNVHLQRGRFYVIIMFFSKRVAFHLRQDILMQKGRFCMYETRVLVQLIKFIKTFIFKVI